MEKARMYVFIIIKAICFYAKKLTKFLIIFS